MKKEKVSVLEIMEWLKSDKNEKLSEEIDKFNKFKSLLISKIDIPLKEVLEEVSRLITTEDDENPFNDKPYNTSDAREVTAMAFSEIMIVEAIATLLSFCTSGPFFAISMVSRVFECLLQGAREGLSDSIKRSYNNDVINKVFESIKKPDNGIVN